MYVYMYICIYVYVFESMYVDMYVCLYVHYFMFTYISLTSSIFWFLLCQFWEISFDINVSVFQNGAYTLKLFASVIKYIVTVSRKRLTLVMDKLLLRGPNLGRVFNSRCVHAST